MEGKHSINEVRFLGRFDTRSGYVGAYRDGFQPPALLRAAEQLHELLPRILDRHTLKYHWAHVFDPAQNPVGIDAHVDEAAVNFNFWVTDDDASLNPDRNGLQVICCHVAPSVLPRGAMPCLPLSTSGLSTRLCLS